VRGRPGVSIGADAACGCCSATLRIMSGGADGGTYRSCASGLDGLQLIGEHGGQYLDNLPLAVIGHLQLAPQAFDRLEGRTVAQGTRLLASTGA
jgi:hypothetical protein